MDTKLSTSRTSRVLLLGLALALPACVFFPTPTFFTDGQRHVMRATLVNLDTGDGAPSGNATDAVTHGPRTALAVPVWDLPVRLFQTTELLRSTPLYTRRHEILP